MSEKTFQADVKRQLKNLGFNYVPEWGQAQCEWDDTFFVRYFIEFSASQKRGFVVKILEGPWYYQAPQKPVYFIMCRLWKAVDRLEAIGCRLLDWHCPAEDWTPMED